MRAKGGYMEEEYGKPYGYKRGKRLRQSCGSGLHRAVPSSCAGGLCGGTPEPVSLRYRSGNTRDREFVVKLSSEAFQRFGPYGEIIDQWLHSPELRFFVACGGAAQVGFSAMTPGGPSNESLAVLLAIAVKPEFHRRGIGSRLLRMAVEWSSREGFRAMEAHTSVDNRGARSLFKRMGFIESAFADGYYPRGQRAVHLLRVIENS